MADNALSARQGKAVEHLVAATCILVSDLELNVSTSLVDDEGVDLVFHRREHSRTLAVQVKSRSLSSRTIAVKSRFRADVGVSTFRPREDLHILFVAIDTTTGIFDPVWLVPSTVLAARKKPNSQNKLVFSASMNSASADQWSPFRCTGTDLAGRVLQVLDGLTE